MEKILSVANEIAELIYMPRLKFLLKTEITDLEQYYTLSTSIFLKPRSFIP